MRPTLYRDTKRVDWLGLRQRGGETEWRKVLYRNRSRKAAEREAKLTARLLHARLTVTEVDGVWVVFRARNRA